MKFFISIALLFFLVFQIYTLHNTSKERQLLALDNAEVHSVKYGMLSVFAWKRQVSSIIAKKVREFKVTDENREEIRQKIETMLYKILDEIRRLIDAKRANQGFWAKMATAFVESIFFDINDLRDRVPEFSQIILDELNNPQSRERMRQFIQNKIDELLQKTVGKEDLTSLNALQTKYDCGDIESCGESLAGQVEQLDKKLERSALLAIAAALIMFCLLLFGENKATKQSNLVLIAACFVLLYAGITIPMIDIDARINSFDFDLMGEPLAFQNQVLFFQSKSIYDVVQILIKTGDYQSMLVGGLIFLFSIVFPIAKLISTYLINEGTRTENRPILNFLAFKSGKWSMADVFVVAIFMAYIGFQGVIDNQLQQLTGISERFEIIATDNSGFGMGFILFLAFCLGSLWLTHSIQKSINSDNFNQLNIT